MFHVSSNVLWFLSDSICVSSCQGHLKAAYYYISVVYSCNRCSISNVEAARWCSGCNHYFRVDFGGMMTTLERVVWYFEEDGVLGAIIISVLILVV